MKSVGLRAMHDDEIQDWRDAIESLIRERGLKVVDRAAVFRETLSTQDAARGLAGGRPGLVVVAGRQSGGRGRLGRSWADTSSMGMAATFVVEMRPDSAGRLSAGGGVAACLAVEAGLERSVGGGESAVARVGLRWPNDVVERAGDGEGSGGGRKIAGVLIESGDGVALVGIGINVGQDENDWPDELRGRAVSLRQLGSAASRLEVILALIERFDRVMAMSDAQVERWWSEREVLLGSVRTFEHNGVRHTGVVEAIGVSIGVVLGTPAGRVELPALTTSLVHE